MRMRKSIYCAAAVIIAGIAITMLSSTMAGRHSFKRETREEILVNLTAREVRTTIASFLWLKVDSYGHFDVCVSEYLPLVRMVASLDPTFIDAYTLGGYWLCEKMKGHADDGIALLKEGIRHNEGDEKLYQIHFELGWQLHFRKEQYEEAAEQFYQALKTMKHEDLNTIYTAGGALRMFAWANLLSGDHKLFCQAMTLHNSVYPDPGVLKIPVIEKLVRHYDSESESIDVETTGLSEATRNRIPPARSRILPENTYDLGFFNDLAVTLKQASSASGVDDDAHDHLQADQMTGRSIEGFGMEDVAPHGGEHEHQEHDHDHEQHADEHEHHDHEQHSSEDTHDHHDCDHEHGDIWNKTGAAPVSGEGLIFLLLGLGCFTYRRHS